jgi:PAS domain S-box-containing protein
VGGGIGYGQRVGSEACSVVIVDDAADVRALVRTRLRLSGQFDVVGEGRTGLEAVALCSEHQPDLVLLDISMPEMDGLEALSRIRVSSPRTRAVMYTGFDETGLAERARELGAAALIEKSVSMATLADQLLAVVGDPPAAAADPTPVEVSDERQESAVLGEHLERFREVFEEAAIGMATMTLTGRVVRANKALAEAVGQPLDALVGHPYLELAPEPDRAKVSAALHRAQDGAGDVVQFEHGVLARDGGRRLLATAAPVRDARGRPLYLFLQGQDVTAQRRAEEDLRQSEQRFRLLVEAVQDYAIFMLDPQGHVVSWNRGAQRIKGYSSSEIIGKHFRIFYPQEMQDIRHPENELELAKRRGVYEEEGWRIRKDGSRFWASVVITAVHDQDGNHIGFAKVTRDMSERRKMLVDAENNARALASANTDLESANTRLAREAADQAQFLAVTAHELRSPIGVLAGSAQLLVDHLDELTKEDRDELSASVTASAERLQRLVRDLLTAARLEARAVRLDLHDVDLGEMLTRVVSSARAAYPDSDIRLDVPTGVQARVDADRLAQAVDNLIGNAVRHGAGPVRVSGAQREDRVEIRVSDSGAGVSPEVQERLFERFASGTTRTGTGLGLFIVRELVRGHGGEARYEVDENGSPTFVLDLPRAGGSAGAELPGMP